jgi:hypothetical protein
MQSPRPRCPVAKAYINYLDYPLDMLADTRLPLFTRVLLLVSARRTPVPMQTIQNICGCSRVQARNVLARLSTMGLITRRDGTAVRDLSGYQEFPKSQLRNLRGYLGQGGLNLPGKPVPCRDWKVKTNEKMKGGLTYRLRQDHFLWLFSAGEFDDPRFFGGVIPRMFDQSESLQTWGDALVGYAEEHGIVGLDAHPLEALVLHVVESAHLVHTTQSPIRSPGGFVRKMLRDISEGKSGGSCAEKDCTPMLDSLVAEPLDQRMTIKEHLDAGTTHPDVDVDEVIDLDGY